MDTKRVKKEFIDAYVKTFGNVSYACRAVNLSRSMYYVWIKEDEEFKNALIEVEPREMLVDAAELQLAKKVNEGDTVAILFTLKTIGKKRGYVEKEVERAPDLEQLQPPNVTFVSQDMSNNATTT